MALNLGSVHGRLRGVRQAFVRPRKRSLARLLPIARSVDSWAEALQAAQGGNRAERPFHVVLLPLL